MEENKDFFQSKFFKRAIVGVGCFLILLMVFWLGIFVGFNKANFSYRWGEQYHQNFAGPKNGFMGDVKGGLEGRGFIDSHGIFGQIIQIDPSTSSGQVVLIVRGPDNVEKIITTSNSTTINKFMENIKVEYLQINDYVVIIGDPNEKGQIEAKLIRVMPSPEESMVNRPLKFK